MATAIELYGFGKDRKSKEEFLPGSNTNLTSSGPVSIQQQDVSVRGQQTNIAEKVQGNVLSGQFDGPVAAAGGKAVDMRAATGPINEPRGPVNQHFGDNITQFIQPQEKPPVPRIQAPPKDFVGREEKLKEIIGTFDSGATITGLWGMGGVGKTALALVLAEKLKSRFPDGQVFLKLGGMSENPLSPAEAMSKVIHSFRGFGERLPEDQDDLQMLYNSILAGKRVLILLDNAADGKQVEPLIPPKGCALLITSRKKLLLPGMPEPFLLVALKPSDARDLLLKICPRMGGQAEEMAKLCGFLPLALRAAASLLAVKSDLSPSSYLEELLIERTRLKKIGKEGVDLDLEASFNLSYNRLPEETARIFGLLSVFPSDFDAHAEEFVCGDGSHRRLSDLVTWSLVEFQVPGRYRLHDLARVFAYSRLDLVTRLCVQLKHSEYYKDILSSAYELYNNGGNDMLIGLGKFDQEWVNIKAGMAWAKENSMNNNHSAFLCSAYLDNPHLLALRMHPRELILWLKTALDAARSLKDQRMEGIHLGNLGIALADTGEYRKAIRYYEQALAIADEIGDSKNRGAWLSNIGLAYYSVGEASKAIRFYEKALAIFLMIGNKRGEGATLGNMGMAYADLGEIRKAIEFYEKDLKIACEIGDKKGEGNCLDCLGIAYATLSENRRAIEYYEQALAIANEIGDIRTKCDCLGNLGAAYLNLGDPHKLIEYSEQALDLSREIGYKRAECFNLLSLGNAYANLSELPKAIGYYKQAFEISREIEDKNIEGNSLFNMSLSLGALGDREEATDIAESALKVYEQIKSPYAEKVRQQLLRWNE